MALSPIPTAEFTPVASRPLALVGRTGADAQRDVDEFFAAHIRNPNTRAA